MSDNMNKVLQEITEAVATKEAELENIRSQISTQKVAAEKAVEEAAEAFNRIDTKAYHSAQDKKRTAEDSIEMLKKHLEKVASVPCLSDEKYKELEAQIRAEYDAAYAALRDEAAQHIAAIGAMKPGLEELWRVGEKALHMLQFDVMNDAPYITTGDGRKVPVNVGEKHLPEIALYNDVMAMVDEALITRSDRSGWA